MKISSFNGKELTEKEKATFLQDNDRRNKIKNRMDSLTTDIINSLVGIEVPNLDNKKAEYITLYNEKMKIERENKLYEQN